jgi:hypothetical protein
LSIDAIIFSQPCTVSIPWAGAFLGGIQPEQKFARLFMPVYRERVYLCPRENGQPGWIKDFPLWWDRRAFFEKYKDRMIDTGNPFYVDYGLLLTMGEAMAWHKRCLESFSRDPESKKVHFVESLAWWEAKLKETSWVIVESYEWESGLD